MRPATLPRNSARQGRLLHIDAADGAIADLPVTALAQVLRPGDVVVVNDAATLPASFYGTTAEGRAIELRLAGTLDDGRLGHLAAHDRHRTAMGTLRFRAVLFGEGNWRARTEDRLPPPPVTAGERLLLGDGLSAVIEGVDPRAPRLLDVALLADARAEAAPLSRRTPAAAP